MKHPLTPLARLRSPHSRWKALARRRRRLIGASFVVALVAGVAGYSYLHSSLAHAYGASAFVMSVKTDNPGTSNATSFTIPITGAGYSYNVDCNDDGINEVSARTTSYTCVYGAAGTYTVAITGTFPRIYFNNAGDRQKLLEVKQWGTIAWTSMANAFYGCNNLQITASDTPNLTVATSLSNMFLNATALTGAGANWNWNTSNITTMNGMFQGAPAFNQPIGSWDTSKVTNMTSMFQGATAFNQPIGSWNTALVTNMSGMFRSAPAFNQPIGSWNTGAVTTMAAMFYGATAFSQPLDTWNTANVTTMAEMFRAAVAFNRPLNTWDVSKVTTMASMFLGATTFNQPLDNWSTAALITMTSMFSGATAFNGSVTGWDVSKVTNMSSVFQSASSFNQPLESWNVGAVTNMTSMFNTAIAFNQPLDNWNTSNVTTMREMFRGARAFNSAVDSWDTSKVTSMYYMFAGASVFNHPIGDWNVSNVTSMARMFENAYPFNQPLNDWDVSKVADCNSLFRGTAFNQPLDHWNLASATSLYSMFQDASSFNQSLDGMNVSNVRDFTNLFRNAVQFNQPLNSWNVSSANNFSSMFYGASNFNQPLDNWDTSKATTMRQMFLFADDFNQPIGMWDTSSVTDFNAMFYYAPAFNQPIGNWNVSSATRFQEMFQGASSFNQYIGNWNTSAATNMIDMFTYARSFNNGQQPGGSTALLNWDTSKVTNMSRMFYNASAFNQPLTTFEIGAVTNMTSMLDNSGYTSETYDQTLAHFAAQPLQPNVQLGTAGLIYCDEATRTLLTSPPNNWVIADEGLCPVAVDGLDHLYTTSDTTPLIKGTAVAGKTVVITIDGTDYTTVAQPDGTFELIIDPPLADGWHTATINSVDSAGEPRQPKQFSFYVHSPDSIRVDGPVQRPTLSWDSIPGSSANGSWTRTAHATASFPVRSSHGTATLNGKLWVLGGQGSSNRLNDVWSSSDGITWTQEVSSAPWSARNGHAVVSFNDKLWVIGGRSNSGYLNDVWSSPDGVNWTQVTASSPWQARASHEVVVHDNKLWVMGGSGNLNDVWSSPDGETWTPATGNADWPARRGFGATSYAGKLWVMGGVVGSYTYSNDVWSSVDGAQWIQETAAASWPVRASHQVEVIDGKMWLLGGSADNWSSEYNDVWFSYDGKQWIRASERADWETRRGHSATVFDDKLWVLGGSVTENWTLSNDVWSLGFSPITYTVCWDTVKDGCAHSATTTDLSFTIPTNLTQDNWYFKVQAGGSNLPNPESYPSSTYEVPPPAPTDMPLTNKPIVHPITGMASTEQVSKALTNATLSVASYDCSDIQAASVRVIEPDGLKVAESGVTLLGGVGFSISCASNGQSAGVALALDDLYRNTNKLRIYKGTGATLRDITDQITFINKDVNGSTKTVISYSLTDGGELDEDGTANSTIVDPIYIGVVEDTRGSLAATGVGTPIFIALALVAITSGSIVLIRITRTGRSLT